MYIKEFTFKVTDKDLFYKDLVEWLYFLQLKKDSSSTKKSSRRLSKEEIKN